MAAALMVHHAGGSVVVRSAGTDPADNLNPAVIEAMAELGIDITAQSPRRLADDDAWRADTIVTMGCGDSCPVYPGKRYLDWVLPDPAGKSIDDVRSIRDEIDRLVRGLVDELLS
jgi:protein-tyrosine-phosphatase